MNPIFSVSQQATPNQQIQSRLMTLAAVFVGLGGLALTLSNAVRLRSWGAPLRWDHWLGVLAWLVLFAIAHRQVQIRLPEADPFLLPIAALLSGWGLLTVWRLLPGFGVRQSAWLAVCILVLLAGLRLPGVLDLLRRYKYLWLTLGLLLTGATFLFGTYPDSAAGPSLWLGCCGIYFQPTETLKLLLVVYLAAYFSTQIHWRERLSQLAAPVLVMGGLALLLLVAQRDLGTALLFIFLFTAVLYVATGRMLVVWISLLVMAAAAVTGYFLFDVVRLRVDSWVNPWLDPSGRSYQIVQSLMAIANGGLFGRGLGLGSPGLVPVAHSDFIFAAIAEETGLFGVVALLGLLALLASRGIGIALRATDPYRRYLAAGLTASLVSQSILIIGGNLRLLPLTGVTLPFVSYGGSSLLTAFLCLLILLHVSNHPDEEPAWLPDARPYQVLVAAIWTGLVAAALLSGWWAVYRADALLGRQDNPRRAIADRYVRRGALVDRSGAIIQATEGHPGEYLRTYSHPDLAPITGYTHATYGQAGLEAALDPTLRGLRGYPALTLWWTHLLSGMPPPGLDVRLTLDLRLQAVADRLMAGQRGALVLLNARSGEILAAASHPGFDPNTLADDWEQLSANPDSPFLDRTSLGQYEPGSALGPFLLAAANPAGSTPSGSGCPLPASQPQSWASQIAAGCPRASEALTAQLGQPASDALLAALHLHQFEMYPAGGQTLAPDLPADASPAAGVSPLQMAMAAAAISNSGQVPGSPHLVSAINLPGTGWRNETPAGQPGTWLDPAGADQAAGLLAHPEFTGWGAAGLADSPEQQAAWYLAGTLPGSPAGPLALAVVIENGDAPAAERIAIELMNAALP